MPDQPELRQRMSDAISAHLRKFGWIIDDDHAMSPDCIAGLVAELLSLPGIAIVEVPQPDSTRYEGDEHEPEDRLCWMPGDDFEVSVWNQGEVQREGFGWGDHEPLSVPEARTIAAVLLAAAKEADAGAEQTHA